MSSRDSTTRLERLRDGVFTGLVRRASDSTGHRLGADRVLPVSPELRDLLPAGGLRRGTAVTLAVPTTDDDGAPKQRRAVGTTSLLMALMAGPSQSGSWCAVVGMPTFHAVAAAETGICLERLALVPYPGTEWSSVVAALLDGIDIVVVAVPGQTPVTATVAHRLTARARQRGAVLLTVGTWPGADLTLTSYPAADHTDRAGGAPDMTPPEIDGGRHGWEGIGQGRGRLRRRRVEVVAWGRGAGARPRRTQLWLPAARGGVATVGEDRAAVTPLPGKGSHLVPAAALHDRPRRPSSAVDEAV